MKLWYYSQCEERWSGGFLTKDEAVDAGLSEWLGETFMVCRARLKPVSFKLPSYWLIEQLDDRNEEACDPDGDGLFPNLTRGQEAHLEAVVAEAIENWAKYWGVTPRAWAFDMLEQETIDEDDPAVQSRNAKLRLGSLGFLSNSLWRWDKLFLLYPNTGCIVRRCS